jgi:hypothetical protein
VGNAAEEVVERRSLSFLGISPIIRIILKMYRAYLKMATRGRKQKVCFLK